MENKWVVRKAYSRNAVENVLNYMEEKGYEFKAITERGRGVSYTLIFRERDTVNELVANSFHVSNEELLPALNTN